MVSFFLCIYVSMSILVCCKSTHLHWQYMIDRFSTIKFLFKIFLVLLYSVTEEININALFKIKHLVYYCIFRLPVVMISERHTKKNKAKKSITVTAKLAFL